VLIENYNMHALTLELLYFIVVYADHYELHLERVLKHAVCCAIWL